MTITLPDELKDELERKARAAGFGTVSEYVVNLVAESSCEPHESEDTGGPPNLNPQNRSELETMIDAGLASGPAIRMTPEFWEERKRALETRAAQRSEGTT